MDNGDKEHTGNLYIDGIVKFRQPLRMTIFLSYGHHPTSAVPVPMHAEILWRLAGDVRRQVHDPGSGFSIPADRLIAASRDAVVNDRPYRVVWNASGPVHDADGAPVLGVCEFDPAMPDAALVSINAPRLAHRPEIAASTVAHELGHVLFDVPAAIAAPEEFQCYRAALRDARALLATGGGRSERRANEFMGALLVPPVALHLRLTVHARAEGLRMVHARHHGRAGLRVVAADNPPEAVAGVLAAVAGDFGVSESFIAVRAARYRLLEGGLRR